MELPRVVVSRAKDLARRAFDKALKAQDSDAAIAGRVAESSKSGYVLLLAQSASDSEPWLQRLHAAGCKSPVVLVLDPNSTVPTLTSGESLEATLRVMPAPTVVLDVARGTAAAQLARWQVAYAYVPKNGVYTTVANDNRVRNSSPWADQLRAPEVPRARNAVVDDLSNASQSVIVRPRSVTATKLRNHYLGVPEFEAAAVLPRRTPALRIKALEKLEPVSYTHRSRVTQHEHGIELRRFEAEYQVPEMHNRHYLGSMRLVSHMLLVHEQTFLPPSFRFPNSENLDAPVAKRLNDRLYSLPAKFEAVSERIETPLYDLSGGWPSHFGHFMQQSVTKLWGWDEAKRQIPELKAAVQIRAAKGHAFEEAILNAYGIASEDIMWVDERLAVSSYVSATSLFQMHAPPYIHPQQLVTWERLGDNLIDPALAGAERIFISRRERFAGRSMHNLQQVEELFSSNGFTIYYPEDHSIAEQASTFATAKVVAGVGGSAMFNLAYARSLETLIILNHESYTARNEHLISAHKDWDVHYFWSRSDVQHPAGGWSVDAYQSSWSFDFARNERALTDLLTSL